MLLLLPIAGFAQKDATSAAIDKIMKEADAYSGKPGFEVLSLGPAELGLTRSLAKLAARLDEDDDEDLEEALILLDGLKKILIVDYEDASARDKDSFNRKIRKILDPLDLLMEAKDEGETVKIYGKSSENGEEIRNFVLFCPEDGDLICIKGNLSLKDLESYIED